MLITFLNEVDSFSASISFHLHHKAVKSRDLTQINCLHFKLKFFNLSFFIISIFLSLFSPLIRP